MRLPEGAILMRNLCDIGSVTRSGWAAWGVVTAPRRMGAATLLRLTEPRSGKRELHLSAIRPPL